MNILSALFFNHDITPVIQTMTYGQFYKVVEELDQTLKAGEICTLHVVLSDRTGVGGILQCGGGWYIPMELSCSNGSMTIMIHDKRVIFDIKDIKEAAIFLEQEMIAKG